MYKILAFITLTFMYSCLDFSFLNEEKDSKEVEEVQNTFQLNIDESFTLPNGNSITLVDVLEDSRCPIDVDCAWEGNLKILLQVNGEAKILNTNLDPRTMDIDGIRLNIKEVYPNPVSGSSIDKKDYSITFNFQ